MNKKRLIHHIILFSFIVILLISSVLKPMKRSAADVSKNNKRLKIAEDSTSFSDLPPDVKEKIIALSSNKKAISATNQELNELASKGNSRIMYHDPLHITPKAYQYQLIQALRAGKDNVVDNLRNQYGFIEKYQRADNFALRAYPFMNDLTKAALDDDKEGVKEFIDQEGQNYSPLRWSHDLAVLLVPTFIATYFGYIDLLKYLLDKDSLLLPLKTKDQYSLLHIAARGEFPEVTKFLLSLNNNESNDTFFNVNAETISGMTPIMLATFHEKIENIILLLQHGASIERGEDHSYGDSEGVIRVDKELAVQCYPDFYAVATGNVQLLQDIKDSQKTENQQFEGGVSSKVTLDGWSLLHVAAENNYPKMTQFLINLDKIDIDGQNDDDMTPLHIAAMHNNVENVSILLDAGADPCSKNAKGNTILGNAIFYGCEDVVEQLLPYYKEEFAQGQGLELPFAPFFTKEAAIKYAKKRGFDSIVTMLSEVKDGEL